MTSSGETLEPWKCTAAALFNPYLNINQSKNSTRQQSVRTRIVTSSQHSHVPPESLVGTGNLKVSSSESPARPTSKHFPSPNASEEVSMYVQQVVHNQFCGRSGTPSDMRYDDQKLRRTINTPNDRTTINKRIQSSRQKSKVSDYPLDDFFNTADEQMSRMALRIPGRESSFSENYFQMDETPRHKSNGGDRLTLGDMCHVASNVGDKMSQSKEKVGLEALRGFRLPSARLSYEPYDHKPMEAAEVLGQHSPNDRIRLSDVLADENFSKEQMIEVIGSDNSDDKSSRNSRTHNKSTTPTTKINEFKDWRGKISQPSLPDVRNRLRRQNSATTISPQRPCTAASNFSKSRPESTGVLINDSHKEDNDNPLSSANVNNNPLGSALKSRSNGRQRQRNYPLNVRIDETINKNDNNQNTNSNPNESERAPSVPSTENLIDPPNLSLPSESIDENIRICEIMPRPTPDTLRTKTTTPYTFYTNDSKPNENGSSESVPNKRNYKLIPSSSRQIYRTVDETKQNTNTNDKNEQFGHLTLSQLELLENYDPTISSQIGIPFIPVQILARPRDSHQPSKRTVQQIQRDYPKKNGQPVFEPRPSRPSQNLIDIAQTLQLTKSKRIRVERQTTFEKPEDESSIEQSVQIKPLENPHRLAISFYSPSEQQSLVKHTNSTRTSSKVYPSQLDDASLVVHSLNQQTNLFHSSKEEERMEYNLSVLNIRTQQEVDQLRRPERLIQRRVVCPTSIVSNLTLNSVQQRNIKQQGRPIPSVFITEDPDELNYSTTIYRQAKNDVDIKRAFKGFIIQNTHKKLSAEERIKREDEQKAAIKIQRAYREHLEKRKQIENRRPPTSQLREQERNRRRIISAKRAQHVEQQIIEQTRIREENKQYKQMIQTTGPSLRIYAGFNRVEDEFSKSTLNRAATCIQRWWRGFIIRHRWNNLKQEISKFGLTWTEFSSRYRGVIQRIQNMRQSEYKQFVFNVYQAREFLLTEKKLTTIYNSLSFNGKLDENELDNFFQCCDLSATPYEIQEALQIILKNYPHKQKDLLTKDIVFDIVYYIYPPVATGLETSRKSTWIRPIIDGEDQTAIQGTPFLEPIDLNIVYKFLGKQ